MSNIQTVDTNTQVLATETNNALTEFMGQSDSWKLFISKFSEQRQKAIYYDIYSYVTKNPENVAKMNYNDFMGRVVDLYSQGLTLQDSHILPFKQKVKNKKTGEDEYIAVATVVAGYQDIVRLAMQTGLFKYFTVSPVFKESIKSFDYKRGVPIFNDQYIPTGKEKAIGYFGYSETHDGMIREIYHSNEYFVDFAHRKSLMNKGKDYLSGPWKDDFPAMCMKTLYKELGKLAPKVKNPTEQQSQFFDYVQAEEEMTEQLDRPKNIDGDGVVHSQYVCSVCGNPIDEKTNSQSIAKYGVALCGAECRDKHLATVGKK